MKNKDVLCINDKYPEDHLAWFAKHNIKYPLEGKHYTIRNVIKHSLMENRNMTGVRLNEINNPEVDIHLGLKIEPSFVITRFVDLQGLPLKKEEIEIKQTNYTEI